MKRNLIAILAAAAVIAAEPIPASFENTPRATPNRIALIIEATMEPQRPPPTALKENAILNEKVKTLKEKELKLESEYEEFILKAKKDSFLSLLFLFFSQVAQAQKSSAGNFIESISCGGSAVLVSMISYSERASVARSINIDLNCSIIFISLSSIL